MQVGELAKLHAKKQELRSKRESLIQEELKKKRREKVNLDQSSVKKGYIEKQKIIAKKKVETLVEKARKIPIELQENVNVNTFIATNTHFDKILTRTKERVQLNRELLQEGITAINSYAVTHKEFVINFTL
jgi:flagellar basal body rod protein FlgF